MSVYISKNNQSKNYFFPLNFCFRHLGSISRKISDQKIKFRPPVAKGESRTTTYKSSIVVFYYQQLLLCSLFFELPSDAPQSFAYMKANCSYELKVKAEVAGRDASVAMALTVQGKHNVDFQQKN